MEYVKIEKSAAQKIVDYLAERPYKDTHEMVRFMVGLQLFTEEPVKQELKAVESEPTTA